MSLILLCGLVGCRGPEPLCSLDRDCDSFAYCDTGIGACVALSCLVDANCPGGSCDRITGICRAGTAGGADGGVDAGVCSPECPIHQECVDGACLARYQELKLLAPVEGALFQPGVGVEVKAELQLVPGRADSPPEVLQVEVAGPNGSRAEGSLGRSAGGYAGNVILGTLDGAYRIWASYPSAGLVSGEVILTVDGTAPSFEVIMPDPPARSASGNTTYLDPEPGFDQAWRRDEMVEVKIRSADPDVNGATISLRGRYGAGAEVGFVVAERPSAECGAGAVWCGVAQVELWRPALNGFRGELSLWARGKDLAGNEAEATGQAKVTRWKWRHEVAGGGDLRAAPAVAGDGTIILGVRTSSSTGSVLALRPSGELAWSKALGAVIGSPAIGAALNGSQQVYLAANGALTGRLYALDVADGSEAVQDGCAPPVAGTAQAGVALSLTALTGEASAAETATTVFSGGPTLVSIRPHGLLKCRDVLSGDIAPYPAAVATRGADAFFGDANGNVRAFTFGSSGWSEKWTVNASLFTNALAVVGTDLVGGGGGPGKGGIFTLPIAGGVTAPSWEHATSSPAWNPVVGAGNAAWVGLNNKDLVRVVINGAASAPVTLSAVAKGAPVLGEGGWLYLATLDGVVSARTQSNPAAAAWSLGGLGEVEASLNLDCARSESGSKLPGRPGTLYAASNNGRLYALVVDSKGIDRTAPWPKYQRDPRNTGSADTQLAQFSCD